MSLHDRLQHRLGELSKAGLARTLPEITHRDGVAYDLAGQRVVGFCSNDYLGLADVPGSAGRPGLSVAPGASASRLICGDLAVHREVERALASLCDAEDAVLFPSGFQLNVGVLPALVELGDEVYSDALNHASMIDGLRLTRARPVILEHTHPPSPPRATERTGRAVRWWVTESVYSMDGDTIDPVAVSAFEAGGGCAYVDEAHAIGLYPHGRGLLASRGVRPTLCVGTLSKAFGSAGAFIAGTATACHYIRTRARSFVFSTGVSPILAAALIGRIATVRSTEGDRRRQRLWDNVAQMSTCLGLAAPNASPIFPVMVGSNTAAVTVAATLLERGFHVQAIRPPTVPDGTARLRLTVSADHTAAQIGTVATAILEALDDHGIGTQRPPLTTTVTPVAPRTLS